MYKFLMNRMAHSLRVTGLFSLLNYALLMVCSGECLHTEGYYWRDFAGIAPKDAFQGGMDYNGRPIYIGQVMHQDKMILGRIYENDSKCYYGYAGKEYTGTSNVKIFCTQDKEQFEWIPTKYDQIHLVTNYHIPLGGYEPGHTVYIGRMFYKSETVIGKVVTGKKDNQGIFITKGGEELLFKSFEILVYNPNKKVKNALVNT